MDVSCVVSPYQDSTFWTPPITPGTAAAILDATHSGTPAVVQHCANVYKRPQKLVNGHAKHTPAHKLDFEAAGGGIPSDGQQSPTAANSSFGANSSYSPSGKKGHIWNGLKEFLQHHQHQSEDVDIEAQVSGTQRGRSKSDAASHGRFARLSFRRKRHSGAIEKQLSTEDSSSASVDSTTGASLEEEEEELRDEPRPLYVDTRLANRVAEDGPYSPPHPGSYPNAWKPGIRQHRSRSNSGGENLLVLRNTSQFYLEILGKLDNPEEVYQQFLMTQSCYDLVPRLAKLVALDTKLTIRRAFMILRLNNLRAAPLWDGQEMRYSGMLTQTDYLEMLSFSNTRAHTLEEEEEVEVESLMMDEDVSSMMSGDHGDHGGLRNGNRRGSLLTLEEWFTKKPVPVWHRKDSQNLLSLDCHTKLLDTARLLLESHYHRVGVVDQESDNMMCLLSLKSILKLLHRNMYFLPIPSWMKSPLHTRHVGTWENLVTITEEAPISEAIDRMLKHRVSSLPVVEEVSGAVLHVLTKSNIVELLSEILKQNDAHQQTTPSNESRIPPPANKNRPKDVDKPEMVITSRSAEQVLSSRVGDAFKLGTGEGNAERDRLPICQQSDLLVNVLDKLATRSYRCVFVVDAEKRAIAAISVSDLMETLIT